MKRKFLVTLSSVGVLATTALLGCSGGKKVCYLINILGAPLFSIYLMFRK